MDIEWTIIKKVACGTASGEEAGEVGRWAAVSPERRRFLDDSVRFYSEEADGGELLSDAALDAAWSRADPARRRLHGRRRMWLAAAAAAAVALLAGVRLFMNEGGDFETPEKAVRITLTDGSVYTIRPGRSRQTEIPGFVVAGDGSLSQAEGEQVADDDAAPLSHIEINVPRGNNYNVTLADSTRVWLNAESTLRFSSPFAGSERRVTLSGEAYFEVARNEDKPFFVDAGDAMVRVLGTSFNVKAYAAGTSSVSLISGSVEVGTDAGFCLLRPGEQCDVNSRGILTVHEADAATVSAWRSDEFAFKDAALHDITDELTRWYGVEVVYDQPDLRDERFYVFVKRSQSLGEVMEKIAKTGRMSYRIEKEKLIISD